MQMEFLINRTVWKHLYSRPYWSHHKIMICFFTAIFFTQCKKNTHTQMKTNSWQSFLHSDHLVTCLQLLSHCRTLHRSEWDGRSEGTIQMLRSEEKLEVPQTWRYEDGRATVGAAKKASRSRGWWRIQPSYFDSAVRCIQRPAIKQGTLKRSNGSGRIFISSLNPVFVLMSSHGFICTKKSLGNHAIVEVLKGYMILYIFPLYHVDVVLISSEIGLPIGW